MKKFLTKQNTGVALLVTILLIGLILFSALYFLSFSLTEMRIARSQSWGAKTYYLAEAGIAEMIWKLKNDSGYKTNFETDPNWTETFTRNEPFGPGSGSYSVTIANSELAHGRIVSTGSIDINGKTSQRIVKISVYRAMGQNATNGNGGYADGNIDVSTSKVNFYGGSAHSNNNFIINGSSQIYVDGDINVVNNYLPSFNSIVTKTGVIYAANVNPPNPAPEVAMPAVDFDSSDPNSYKNKADVVYTQAQFDNLMQNNQTLTLNDAITYVSGDVDAYGAQNLVINGLLVVERDFQLGRKECRTPRCGPSTLTINHSAGQPTGILAKRIATFYEYCGEISINGVIYANDQLNILNYPLGNNFNIIGASVSRKLTITSSWQPINITYDDEIVNSTLGPADFSPTITVEHWEEEY